MAPQQLFWGLAAKTGTKCRKPQPFFLSFLRHTVGRDSDFIGKMNLFMNLKDAGTVLRLGRFNPEVRPIMHSGANITEEYWVDALPQT